MVFIEFFEEIMDYHYSSQFQSVSSSDAADLKNNLTQTRSSEFSDPTEIGGIMDVSIFFHWEKIETSSKE